MKIELFTCDSGGWEILKVDGKYVYESPSIPGHIWKNILKGQPGIELVEKELSVKQIADMDFTNE